MFNKSYFVKNTLFERDNELNTTLKKNNPRKNRMLKIFRDTAELSLEINAFLFNNI